MMPQRFSPELPAKPRSERRRQRVGTGSAAAPNATGIVLGRTDLPTGLRSVVERAAPCEVVILTGTLNLAAMTIVHTNVATSLSRQPAAILIDVGDLRLGDPAALEVFARVAEQAARWPGTPLALCRPDPPMRAALRASPTCRNLPVYPTLEAAMAGIEDDTASGQLIARLLPAAGAARQARELVTEACARWDMPELVGPACTVVTELVNNVVVHARTPMEVVVRLRSHQLSISVRDEGPGIPQARGPASPTAPGGRGLMMVEAVAQRWGYTTVGGGKVVWAVLHADTAASSAC